MPSTLLCSSSTIASFPGPLAVAERRAHAPVQPCPKDAEIDAAFPGRFTHISGIYAGGHPSGQSIKGWRCCHLLGAQAILPARSYESTGARAAAF